MSNNYTKLEDQDLISDFLFEATITYGEEGRCLCKYILETILQREVGDITISAQMSIQAADVDRHGIRMDAYVEEKPGDKSLKASIYDIEPNNTPEISELPYRVRFYNALIDRKDLESGQSYSCLKNVYIIMILPYDPFGENRCMYTVKSKIEECPQVSYEDGVKKLFLFTKGTKGAPSQELRDMLKYIQDSREENVTNEKLAEMHRIVEKVKHDEEVGIGYMKLCERDEEKKAEGRREGMREGRREGNVEGQNRINRLICELAKAGRQDDILKAAQDTEYQEQLLEEFGINGKLR